MARKENRDGERRLPTRHHRAAGVVAGRQWVITALMATMVLIDGAGGAPSPAPTAADPNGRCDDEAVAEYWRTFNAVLYTQSVFGGLSIIASMAVLSVGYAYGKDRRSLRGRIIAGLFVSNLVFAIGIAVPVGANKCADGNFVAIYAWRTSDRVVLDALFYSGKVCPTSTIQLPHSAQPGARHGLVAVSLQSEILTLPYSTPHFLPSSLMCFMLQWWMMSYELFIVAASVLSLRSGSINIARDRERIAHTACFAVVLIVFLVFVIKGGSLHVIMRQGGTSGHVAYVEYKTMEEALMDGWVAVFGIFAVMWGGLNWQLRRFNEAWAAAKLETKEEWQHEDRWIAPGTAVHDARARKQQLLNLQKQSCEEVVLPLAPYVWTFGAFSIPAILMATDYCTDQSERVNTRSSGPALPCYTGCYMVLAMRPLATAAVYFRDSRCRAELWDYRTLGRKLWARLSDFFAWALGREDRRRGLRFNHKLEEVRIIDEDNDAGTYHEDVDDDGGGGGGAGTAKGASVRYELMED